LKVLFSGRIRGFPPTLWAVANVWRKVLLSISGILKKQPLENKELSQCPQRVLKETDI
jgi:hypothetical protein